MNNPQFVMTKSARTYAVELQELSATRYRHGRIGRDTWNDESRADCRDDEKRELVLSIQRNAAATYARFVGVMGFAD